MTSKDTGYRAKRHGPWQALRPVARRLEALSCLLIIMAQLALIVTHSWEVSVDEGARAVTRVSRAFLTAASGAPAIAQAAPVPRRTAHDPLLCPVCQLLSQAKNGLAPHGPGMFLLLTSLPVLPGSSFSHVALALAVSAPRAPPCFL